MEDLVKELSKSIENWKDTAFEFALVIYEYAWRNAVNNESLFKTFYAEDIQTLVDTFGYEYLKRKLEEAINDKDFSKEIENSNQ